MVAWSIQFLGYERTLSSKFQKAKSKIVLLYLLHTYLQKKLHKGSLITSLICLSTTKLNVIFWHSPFLNLNCLQPTSGSVEGPKIEGYIVKGFLILLLFCIFKNLHQGLAPVPPALNMFTVKGNSLHLLERKEINKNIIILLHLL